MPEKTTELPILVKKADNMFRISPIHVTSLAGDNKKLIIQHGVGSKKVITLQKAMIALGLRNAYLEKKAELMKKYRHDREGLEMEDALWQKHFRGQAKGALNRVISVWEEHYEGQDLLPCATWVPTGDREIGSVFGIWAMITISSRRVAVGVDRDYAKYTWVVKKSTQSPAERNAEVTRDIVEYLKSGHAGKEVQYFLSQILKGDIPQKPPPALGFDSKS